ncbi:DEAD/DEAH box helicase [Parafrankia elaeagni]|uniref:DEAD/DEAH box helicase n=1 Tax=Parafrankia elaeagni TaxID=222534 RepID=UPI0003A112DB|nr:DEAD/DEAH box helicase [Parafrankia elaeagni]
MSSAPGAVEEFVARYPFGLDPFQSEAVEALARGEGVLVAAPTGAGKTIVGEFAAHLALATGTRCFYTTPIKALSNQKYADLVARYGAASIGLLTGDTSRNGDAPVVVMTTEVLRNMLYSEAADSSRLADLGYVVMDEVHYLADRQRGAVWEEVIIHLPNHVRLVSLSATVSNAEEFAEWLVTVRGHTRVIVSEHRPVPLYQHVLADRTLHDLFVDSTGGLGPSGLVLEPDRAGPRGGRGVRPGGPASTDAFPGRGAGGGSGAGPAARWGAGAGPGADGSRRVGARNGAGGSGAGSSGAGGGGAGGGGATGRGGDGEAAGGRTVNPDLLRLAREESQSVYDRGRGPRSSSRPGARPGGGGGRRRYGPPSRPDVIVRLDRAGLLPAIVFIFSRVGCDAAVTSCVQAGLRLTTSDERREINAHVRARTAGIPQADLEILGYWQWLDGLERGIASHHAGMLPTFKEVVEELFVRGLVRAVFATETLALGINMPARTVVLERLTKFNGQTRANITPGEYTQLTGRAGRRSIDVEGHAVVLWQPGLDPLALAGLASTRTYPLRSSFRPSYNMAVNLVGRLGADRARVVLESSFAQFQADKAVVGIARAVRRNQTAIDELAAALDCDRGAVLEYDDLRRQIRERENNLSRAGTVRRQSEVAEALAKLRSGDVVRVPAGRRGGLVVVLDAGVDPGSPEGPRPVVLTVDRQVRRLSMIDFPVAVEPLARVRIPKSFNPRSPQARRDLASSLRNTRVPDEPGRRERMRSLAADDAELARLRRALRAHPVHDCPRREEHLRSAERIDRLRRETAGLERKVEGRTNTVARTFDRVRDTLAELRYLSADGDAVTPAGAMLARIYTEQDLQVAECLRTGVWVGLTPPELAAAVSTLLFEPRGDDVAPPAVPGGPALRDALADMAGVYTRLGEVEDEHRLGFLRAPDLGFVPAAFGWASGRGLERVLTEAGADLTAGDFVRWMRQLIDLLDQIAQIAPAFAVASAGARARGEAEGVAGGEVGGGPGGERAEGPADRGAGGSAGGAGLVEVGRVARAAMDAVRRGVVAYSMSV